MHHSSSVSPFDITDQIFSSHDFFASQKNQPTDFLALPQEIECGNLLALPYLRQNDMESDNESSLFMSKSKFNQQLAPMEESYDSCENSMMSH